MIRDFLFIDDSGVTGSPSRRSSRIRIEDVLSLSPRLTVSVGADFFTLQFFGIDKKDARDNHE
jgi:hypothetical protein